MWGFLLQPLEATVFEIFQLKFNAFFLVGNKVGLASRIAAALKRCVPATDPQGSRPCWFGNMLHLNQHRNHLGFHLGITLPPLKILLKRKCSLWNAQITVTDSTPVLPFSAWLPGSGRHQSLCRPTPHPFPLFTRPPRKTFETYKEGTWLLPISNVLIKNPAKQPWGQDSWPIGGREGAGSALIGRHNWAASAFTAVRINTDKYYDGRAAVCRP